MGAIAMCRSLTAARSSGSLRRFDFSRIELDRLDEETGLWERI
jgi:hypothetical protein